MLSKFLINAAMTALIAIVGTLGVVVAIGAAARMEVIVNPVMTDWTPTMVKNVGTDLVLTGTVIKHRNCEYIPPPRARTADGYNLLVRSLSPAPTGTWPASDVPQVFGPWVVVNGAGRHVEFFQQHRCHALYSMITELGTIEGNK